MCSLTTAGDIARYRNNTAFADLVFQFSTDTAPVLTDLVALEIEENRHSLQYVRSTTHCGTFVVGAMHPFHMTTNGGVGALSASLCLNLDV